MFNYDQIIFDDLKNHFHKNRHLFLQNFTILRFDQIFQNILRVIRHILMLFQLY
jgi:hypothetical protein